MSNTVYRVTGRAKSKLIFKPGDSLSINYPRDGKNGHLVFATRYIDAGLEFPVPGDLMVVADVEADSVEDAFTWLSVGRELAGMIAVAGNAAIDHVMGELAYDITPGRTEREFFQRFMVADEIEISSRKVSIPETIAFIDAVAHSEHRQRLTRAISQYSLALNYWSSGNELLCISHLWMGVEAIAKAHLRFHLEASGQSSEGLAADWGYRPKGGRMTQQQFLDSTARLKLVCQGDMLHCQIARDVSDAFEHGLESGGMLFARAREALVPTATYLRHSILVVSGMSSEGQQALAEKYRKPRGPVPLEQYFRSTIQGVGDHLADAGRPHPCVDWTHSIKSVSLNEEDWVYSYTPDTKMTARIGPGLVLAGHRFEAWDAGQFMPESAGERVVRESAEGAAKP